MGIVYPTTPGRQAYCRHQDHPALPSTSGTTTDTPFDVDDWQEGDHRNPWFSTAKPKAPKPSWVDEGTPERRHSQQRQSNDDVNSNPFNLGAQSPEPDRTAQEAEMKRQFDQWTAMTRQMEEVMRPQQPVQEEQAPTFDYFPDDDLIHSYTEQQIGQNAPTQYFQEEDDAHMTFLPQAQDSHDSQFGMHSQEFSQTTPGLQRQVQRLVAQANAAEQAQFLNR